MTFPAHVPNVQLTLARVPSPDAAWDAIREFAYTFHAYDHHGANGPVAAIANARRADTLTEARTCLFFEHRRMVHSPESFDSPEKQAWLRELVHRIRGFVEAGRLDVVPGDDRIYSPERTRYVRWRRRDRDDLWDHDSSYEIVVFDAATAEQLSSYIRTHNTGYSGESGKALTGVRWSEDGRLLLVYRDSTEELAERPH